MVSLSVVLKAIYKAVPQPALIIISKFVPVKQPILLEGISRFLYDAILHIKCGKNKLSDFNVATLTAFTNITLDLDEAFDLQTDETTLRQLGAGHNRESESHFEDD